MEFSFLPELKNDKDILFSVIAARFQNKWVFCKHKERDTLEFPGGHREEGETPLDCAKRELWEETGALEYTLEEIAPYSVTRAGVTTIGLLYYANIQTFGELPALEMEKILLLDNPPSIEEWTYPQIQPHLLKKLKYI